MTPQDIITDHEMRAQAVRDLLAERDSASAALATATERTAFLESEVTRLLGLIADGGEADEELLAQIETLQTALQQAEGARVSAVLGWEDANQKLAAKSAALNAANEALNATELELEAATASVASLTARLEGMTNERNTAISAISAKDLEIAALKAEIERLTNPDTPPPPDPTFWAPAPRKIRVGACPPTSGGTPAGVVTKYGAGVALRTFDDDGDGMKTPVRPSGCDHLHHSWKPELTELIPEADLIRCGAVMLHGDQWSIHHEFPTKIRDGRRQASEADTFLRQHNDFYAKVVKLRERGDIPLVGVNFTDAAWMWDSRSGFYPGTSSDPRSAAYWGERIECDVIGVDLDAYAKSNGYPTTEFKNVIDNVIAFCKRYGFVDPDGNAMWSAPEFIHFTISTDSAGNQRATFLKAIFDYCIAKGDDAPTGIQLFDTEWSTSRPNQDIAKPSPEFTAVLEALAKTA